MKRTGHEAAPRRLMMVAPAKELWRTAAKHPPIRMALFELYRADRLRRTEDHRILLDRLRDRRDSGVFSRTSSSTEGTRAA